MKRIISLASLLILLLSFSAYAQLPGDFNCSGNVSGLDATFIISQYSMGLIDTASCTWDNGDLNGDTLFHSVADWRQLFRFLGRDTLPNNPPQPFDLDTIRVGHINTGPGQTVTLPITITTAETIFDIMIQVEVDTTYLTNWAFPGARIYSNGHFYRWDSYDMNNDSTGLPPGSYQIDNLSLTIANDCPVDITIPITIIGGNYYPSGLSNDSYPTYFIRPVYVNGAVHVTRTGISEPGIPQDYDFGLKSFPNPFNASTVISYTLPLSGDVELDIFNLLGQRIITIADGTQSTGPHKILWDAATFPSGIYFARLQVDENNTIAKLILLK